MHCGYPPRKPVYRRAVAIPSSNFSNLPEPARTFHKALLARALGIFRVEELAVFEHEGISCDEIKEFLEALEVPQYLRKRLVPRKKSLRYVGLVPPLSIPSHQLKNEDFGYREGLVVGKRGGKLIVDIGLPTPVEVEGDGSVGARVTLRRTRSSWVLVEPELVELYWGYRVKCFNSLESTVEHYRSRGFLIVSTSRKGEVISTDKLVSMAERLRSGGYLGILVVFGSWKKGLYEISLEEGLDIERVSDYIFNTIPCQGTRTVRTEEAVLTTLSLLNIAVE